MSKYKLIIVLTVIFYFVSLQTSIAEFDQKKFQALFLEQQYQENRNELGILKDLAEQGDTASQLKLAEMYYRGVFTKDKTTNKIIIKTDYELAAKWYKSASDLGNQDAMLKLAQMYGFREVSNHNWRDEMALLLKAAKLGNMSAQFRLGLIYSRGPSEQRVKINQEVIDQNKACSWYQKSAEQGHTGAQSSLAMCYELGRGAKQNTEEAIKWYTLAANKGRQIGCDRLGMIYFSGRLFHKITFLLISGLILDAEVVALFM